MKPEPKIQRNENITHPFDESKKLLMTKKNAICVFPSSRRKTNMSPRHTQQFFYSLSITVLTTIAVFGEDGKIDGYPTGNEDQDV